MSENVLSACLAESENTTLKLEEELTELKDQTTPHLSIQEGIYHLNFSLYNKYTITQLHMIALEISSTKTQLCGTYI